MTTWSTPEDGELAEALGMVVAHLERQHAKGAVEAAREMRSALTPGNGFRTATVPFAVRGTVARALLDVAEGHPLAERLQGIAEGFEAEAAVRIANGHR
jgi:hypothetical protein